MTSEARNLLLLDLNSITKFQEEFHYPDINNTNEEVNSRFTYIFEKSSWSSHIRSKMHANENGKTVTYNPGKKYDFLFDCIMTFELPEYRVNEAFKNLIQICWTPNCAHHISQFSCLKLDDDIVGTLNPIWMDIREACYEKRRGFYKRMIGSSSLMTEWTNFLPRQVVNVPQPWFYTKHISQALPLLNGSMNVVTHEYKFNLDISKFLRMRGRKSETDEFRPIKFNKSWVTGDAKIKTPELWGRFAQVSEEERTWHKKMSDTRNIDDVILITYPNTVKCGETITVPLNAKLPCKAYFWVAENQESLKYNYYSNYSTNPDNIMAGWNPCSSYKIKYTNDEKVSASYEQSEFSELYTFFPGGSKNPGYNVHCNCYDIKNIHTAEPSVVPHVLSASLELTLENTDPYNSQKIDENEIIIDSPEENKCSFKIHVAMIVTKKLKISWKESEKKLDYQIFDNAIDKIKDK